MNISCVVNKQSVTQNKELRKTQKKARKYYQERLFEKAQNVPKAKIRKLADLKQIEYVDISNVDIPTKAIDGMSKDELLLLCDKVGLTGRSGSGFPVSKKLKALKNDEGILIINGVECDPGLVTDSWLYRNRKQQLEQGAALLKKALNLNQVILVTKEPLQKINNIEQMKIADRFPLGYENYLIKNILGVDICNNELPQDKGILVMNLQTVIAIDEIVKNPLAAQYKYITVANLYTAEAKVARVRIGDSIDYIAKKCFSSDTFEKGSVYAGGGAFSCHKADSNAVITDTVGYIALGTMPQYNDVSKCKGCGKCTRNCPAGVLAHKVIRNTGNVGECVKYNVSSCIGCGACTYGCNASIDVRKVIAWTKAQLL